MDITLNVNGSLRTVGVTADATLLDVLRNDLRLLGAKEGCREGECGACTVLLDGLPVDACIYSAAAAEGRTIDTVETLSSTDLGRRLQRSFVDRGGVQCGFCTPGFIVTLAALLRENPDPTDAEIRDAVAGNICRCTGYSQIVDAALAVAGKEAS